MALCLLPVVGKFIRQRAQTRSICLDSGWRSVGSGLLLCAWKSMAGLLALMKFEIDRDAFLEGLQQVQHVVSTRTTLPILSNVLIEAEGDGLQLTTTDLDVGVSGRVVADVQTGGATTLPVRRLVKHHPRATQLGRCHRGRLGQCGVDPQRTELFQNHRSRSCRVSASAGLR